jgi:hypothetical protein
MCILDRTQGDISSLKKTAKCVQYVHRLEQIWLLVYFLVSDSLPGVVHFCMYVHDHVYIYVHHTVCGLVTKFIIAKFIHKNIHIYATKFIQNKI